MKRYMIVEVNAYGYHNATFFGADDLDEAEEYGDAASALEFVSHVELYGYQTGKGYWLIRRWK